ncbi:TPA: phospholipase D family protein [Streptococcus suis]
MLIVKKLFETIFDEVDSNTKIRVITGYTSSNFLGYFINSFKGISLELYIGMSQQGISEQDHQKYVNLMLNNPHVKIYYQIRDNLTHIKLIELTKESSSRIYVGSANFSYDGLFKHNELMTLVNENINDLFINQKLRSTLVNSEEAKQLVLANEPDSMNIQIEDAKLDSKDLVIWERQVLNASYRLRRDYRYFKKFTLPPRFQKSNDKENNEYIILKLRSGFRTSVYFPIGKDFICHFEKESIKCYIGARFNTEIHIKDIDNVLFQIIAENKDAELEFTRINESEYFISFSKL